MAVIGPSVVAVILEMPGAFDAVTGKPARGWVAKGTPSVVAGAGVVGGAVVVTLTGAAVTLGPTIKPFCRPASSAPVVTVIP